MNLPGGGVLLGIRRGGVPPGSTNPGSKSCFFHTSFQTYPRKIHTRFQTWRRQKLCYHYLH